MSTTRVDRGDSDSDNSTTLPASSSSATDASSSNTGASSAAPTHQGGSAGPSRPVLAAPPPPPPPKALSKGKGKGKGKGIAQPLPRPPPAVPPPQAKGKGKHQPRPCNPPPAHLKAPPPGRGLVNSRRYALSSTDGTIWQGLSNWDASGDGVLEECEIDVPLMLSPFQSQPTNVAPAPLRQTRVEAIGDFKLSQKLHILVRGQALNADLVRKALTRDFDALKPDQAAALFELVPIYMAVRVELNQFVQAKGLGALDAAEAVLWTLGEVPLGWALARCAHVRAMLLQGDFKEVCDIVDGVCNHVTALETSRAVRTVLQIVLVHTNIIAQDGLDGLSVRSLDYFPRAISIVAQHLEAMHARRCRLRFMRLFAVGKLPITSTQKRFVWSYLDDLRESPWDAVPLLIRGLPNSGLTGTQDRLDVEMAFIDRESRALQNLMRQDLELVDPHVREQLFALESMLADADDSLNNASDRLADTSVHVCRLFGQVIRRPQDRLSEAALVLSELQRFGRRLETEMRQSLQVRGAGGSANRLRWGFFPVVDTAHYVASVTADLDLIRCLRAPATAPTVGVEAVSSHVQSSLPRPTPKAVASRERLMHGGPEGEYRRCEETGRWVPVGFMAAVRPEVPQSGRIPGL